MASETGVSQGTIKHAYDVLEQTGVVEQRRGSGTFVKDIAQIPHTGARERAIKATDAYLDLLMKTLSFSPQEARVFFELRLREREEETPFASVAVVECCPETLNAMSSQILDLGRTEVIRYLLEDIEPGVFDPTADLVVTTPTHSDEVFRKIPHDKSTARLVMAAAPETIADLAALPPNSRVGITCVSKRFAGIILASCEEYCRLETPPQIACFRSKNFFDLIRNCDTLVVPMSYDLWASQTEKKAMQSSGKRLLRYRYAPDKGSLLYLEEQVERILKAGKTSGFVAERGL
jgi:hypothetical protein